MDSFSISDLAQYSGIKPHTIRIWEKRYNALKPDRSLGNTRHYNNSHLRRLLNISGLLNTDNKVSELCAMSDEKLECLNGQILQSESSGPNRYFISQLISAALHYDEVLFTNLFSHCLLRFGLKDTYLNVLYPVLVRIGLMWQTGKMATASEHFISNLVRQKFFTTLDSLPPFRESSSTWILFLPENEFHELGLLMANYLLRISGCRVIYLGMNVPVSSVRTAVKQLRPDHILLFFVHNDMPENLQNYLDKLGKDLPVKKIYAALDPGLASQVKKGKKIHFLQSPGELERILSENPV